jgi:hypothetical protein
VIERLRRMIAEATPGPLRVGAGGYSVECDAEGWLFDVYSMKCGEDAALIAAAVNALPALLDAAEAWRDYLSAQRTIDDAGFMDNYTDAARGRDTQAKAIDRARRALAALAKEGT